MNNQILKLSIIILSSIFLLGSLALAGGKGKGKIQTKPPGWEQGEKTGWKGEDTPPGLTKEKLEKKQKTKMKGDRNKGKAKNKSEKAKHEAGLEKEKADQEAEIEKEKKKREPEIKKEKEKMKSN
jgi:hypothetical protein